MEKILIGIGGKIFLTIIAFIVLSCSTESNMKLPDTLVNNVFKLILSDEEFHQYLHLELEERSPILIATNHNIPISTKPDGFDVVLHVEKISELYIEVVKFVVESNSVEFEINYEVEGVTFQGVASKKNGQWVIQKKSIFES